MSDMTMIEKSYFEELFDMKSGYVIDGRKITDAKFQEIVIDAVKKNIHHERYTKYGTSKAKKLKAFWEDEPNITVGKVLKSLLDIHEFIKPDIKIPIQCRNTVNRLLGMCEETPIIKNENDFLREDFGDVKITNIKCLDHRILPVLESRLVEVFKCVKAESPLATIFMCGSIFEGILLGVATSFPREFNSAKCSPKYDDSVKKFHDWTLNDYISVAHETGFIGLDVKKFSESLRDFRNYIHPYAQMSSGFAPDKHTAEICLQVLKAAIADLSNKAG